jgi:hypothetical protein
MSFLFIALRALRFANANSIIAKLSVRVLVWANDGVTKIIPFSFTKAR